MAELPSRQEIRAVADTALDLIGEGSWDNHAGHGPGNMFTATAEYSIPDSMQVRIATYNEWKVKSDMPDLLLTVAEGYGEADQEGYPAHRTDYMFMESGIFRPYYAVNMDTAEVRIDINGRADLFVPLLGDTARGRLAYTKMSRKERRALRDASELTFDRVAFTSLKDTLALCGPHNRVQRGDDEW